MSGRYRFLILLVCMALACAGLPVHACAETGDMTAEDAQLEQPISESAMPCPHHAAAGSDAVAANPDTSTGFDDPGCCGLDCSCCCGTTAPVLSALSQRTAAGTASTELSLAAALAPSLSPDRLLRPPIPSA